MHTYCEISVFCCSCSTHAPKILKSLSIAFLFYCSQSVHTTFISTLASDRYVLERCVHCIVLFTVHTSNSQINPHIHYHPVWACSGMPQSWSTNTIRYSTVVWRVYIPSLHDLLNVRVGSISFLILIRASSTIGPHVFRSTWYTCIRGLSPGLSGSCIKATLIQLYDW